jgi:hypothetical protein
MRPTLICLVVFHGSYGYNCNESCDGCLSDSCDKEHGVCTDASGCKPGWQHGQTKCDLLKKENLETDFDLFSCF